jgi:NADH-quinone oxidoreductase subunit C
MQSSEQLARNIKNKFSAALVSIEEKGRFPHVVVEKGALLDVLQHCAEDAGLKFDFLECITGVDTGQDICVIYQLYSSSLFHRFNVKVLLDRHKAKIKSVTGLWPAATYHELEVADLFGVEFSDHPNPRRLLLPDDWQGHPLRKDYSYPEEYHDIEHRRPPVRKEHVRP